MGFLINPHKFSNPDLQAYLDVLPQNPTSGVRSLVSSYINSLKAGANNFSKLDLAAITATDFRANAYYSVKNPELYVSQEDGNLLWNQHGFKGNTASHLKSGFNLFQDSVNYQSGNACFYYWSLTDVDDNSACDGGAQDGTAGGHKGLISFGRGGNIWGAAINDDAASNIQATGITNSLGFYSVVRIGNTVYLYKNGVVVHFEDFTETGIPDLELWIFGLNRAGVLFFPSPRQIPVYGLGKGDMNQPELYASNAIYVNGILSLYPSPAPPSVKPISAWDLDLQFPPVAGTITDNSGNNYDSVLSPAPGGLTSATVDGNNSTVFSGLQGIAINSSFTLPRISNSTLFIVIDTEAPENIMNIINLGTQYRASLMVHTEVVSGNKYVTAGICYFDEDENDRPLWGKSLLKLQTGRNLIGFSFDNNTGTGLSRIYLNGLVSYFQPDNSYGAGAVGGIIGAFPGGSGGNVYTVDANYSIPANGFIKIKSGAANTELFQATGDSLMQQLNLNLIVFELDSITAGATLSNNADTFSNKILEYLIANTPYKWAGANMAIPGRTLQEAASEDQTDSTVDYYSTDSVIIKPVNPIVGGRNVFFLLAPVNDIALGRSLAQIQADLTSVLNYRNAKGFICFVLTCTGDGGFDATKEQIRLDYNDWLRTQEAALNFTLIDICNLITGLNTSPVDAGLRNDTVHLNDIAHQDIADVSGPIILANI